MEKADILAALPRLLILPPNVLRESFNRLLEPKEGQTSAVSPSELLIALHMLDPVKDKLTWPAIIEGTNQCFARQNVYTQEVLAVVLQQLVDVNPLPFLFMRTVMRALDICPKLAGFVMSILSRLITKQVWKQPKLWEGFVKCCEKMRPISFGVLLQLPGKQMESCFSIAPDLKPALVTYAQALRAEQLAVVERSTLSLLGLFQPAGQAAVPLDVRMDDAPGEVEDA
eukprot:Opistho-2@6109